MPKIAEPEPLPDIYTLKEKGEQEDATEPG